MKLINPLNHPHSGKAAILIAIALVLGITVHEVFFLIALLIAAIACMEWGAHEVHVIHELHERKTHGQPQPASLATRVALHPFLAGMSRTASGVANRLRDRCSLRERANDFAQRRVREGVLFDRKRRGGTRVRRGVRRTGGGGHDWSGGSAWLVVDVPAVHLAVHRARGRTH
jgi:hypothetical protein